MADPALTFLLGNLKQLVEYYAHLISGSETELERLENELDLLKAFLRETASKRKKDEYSKELERQIRDMVYVAEDTIDSCFIQALAAKPKNALIRCFSGQRVSLAEEVQDLRKKKITPMVQVVGSNYPRNTGSDGSPGSCAEEQPKTVPNVIRQDNIVGFHDQVKVLVGYDLKEEKDELDVISITGSSGLGKTTLALQIYKEERAKREFDVFIWIQVSKDPNLENLFNNIVDAVLKATKKDISSLTRTNSAIQVHECLEEIKFLLVLDDIWSVETWNIIKNALPLKNKLGKVLITSRYEIVGIRANGNRKPHVLSTLNDEECWELLKLEVFGKQKSCPPELLSIGKLIATQCEGLPLTVILMGGKLLNEYNETQSMAATVDAWNKVANATRNYVSSDVVSLYYEEMPDQLKDCFLYLGVFPEAYDIPTKTLIRLWIAEGFIHSKGEQSLEETAMEMLKDLINKKLVKVVKNYLSTGEVKTCKVHDDIRKFCITNAALREKNLFKEIKLTKDQVFDPPISGKEKYRRLCIHLNLPKFLSEKPVGQGVRSFLCFYREKCILDSELISLIPESFKLLRVLDVMSTKFVKFPTKFSKLIHLRYITLSFDDLEVLPKSISELRCLQTLIVVTTKSTIRIEANIWIMSQLRHLITKASINLVEQVEANGGTGKNLQTLRSLSPKSCTGDVITKASNLKTLEICGQLQTELKFDLLERLDHLENLKLQNDLFSGSARENPLRVLPQANNFPKSLKKLTLSATYLEWKHMHTLGMIVTLEVLKLKDNAFAGSTWDLVSGGFRQLKFLLIASTDIVEWKASGRDHEFPLLKCLVLNCERLRVIPFDQARRNDMNIQWKQPQDIRRW